MYHRAVCWNAKIAKFLMFLITAEMNLILAKRNNFYVIPQESLRYHGMTSCKAPLSFFN